MVLQIRQNRATCYAKVNVLKALLKASLTPLVLLVQNPQLRKDE